MVIIWFKWPEPDGTSGSGSGTYLNWTESPVCSSQILSENQTKPDLSITTTSWDIYHSEKGKFIIIQISDWFRGIVYIPANPL
jgi:hypothetical protein